MDKFKDVKVEKYFTKPDLNKARKRKNNDSEHIDFKVESKYIELGNNKKYLVQTYGCQGNEADSEKISGLLETIGFTLAKDPSEADLILLNTCAVRENAENRIWGELGRLKRYKRTNPDLLLGVCGCMPQEEVVVNSILKKFQFVDIIFGTHNIFKLPEYLLSAYYAKERVVEVFSNEGNIVENLPTKRDLSHKAWVNIMYGCDEFCTYCIVPYTRGRERSRKKEAIIEEIIELSNSGVKEVTLLGQNVNAYGKDLKDEDYKFADLLTEIQSLPIERVTFTTSHPRDLDDETINILGKRGNLIEYLHLPVQSGNNEILKSMNRKYTIEDYKNKIKKLRELVPDISITTDIIVGFPGETEEQFQDTLDLVNEIGYDGAYTFVYSKREGTPAAKYDDNISEDVKKQRLYKLNDAVNTNSKHKNDKFLNETVSVLVDGPSKSNKDVLCGYTRHKKLINFKGSTDLIGRIVDVKVTESKTWSLFGEIVE